MARVRFPGRLTVLLTLLITATLAYGQIDSGETDLLSIELPLEVYVDGGGAVTPTLVTARVTGLSRVEALAGPDLSVALSHLVTPELEEHIADLPWWTPEALSEIGLETQYNPGGLRADITVPAALQATRQIALSSGAPLPPYPSVAPAGLSASIPLHLSGEHREETGLSDSSFAILAMPAVNLSGWLLEGELQVEGNGDGESELDRWEARLVHDLPSRQLRWSAGHVGLEPRGLQGGSQIVGTAIERRGDVGFGESGSTRYLRRFEVNSTSLAEVFVNGRLLRSLTLEPGSYELSDFPLLPGTNDVEIRLTDRFGQIRRLNGSVSYAGELLEKGDRGFGLAAGVPARSLEDSETSPEPLGRGFFRYGAGESVTLGVYGEGAVSSQLVGLELLTAGYLGVYEVTGAGSHGEGGVGYAGRLNYSLPTPRNPWLPSLGLNIEYRSREFAPVGEVSAGRGVLTTGGTLHQSLPLRSSLLLGATYRFSDDGRSSSTYFAGLGKQIGSSTNLRVSASLLNEGGQESWGVQISLVSRPFGGRGSVGTTYDVEGQELEIAGGYTVEGERAQGSVGLRAQGLGPEREEPRSLSGSLQGTVPQLEGYLALTQLSPDSSETASTSRLTGRLGTGVYFADGLLGIGRPSTESFLLVGRGGGLRGGEIFVNPTDRGAEARSGLLGTAILPSLGAYRYKPLQAEVSGVPVDYALGPTAFVVESGYRTGTAVRITGSKLLYGTGRLIDQSGAPVSLQVFEVTREGSTVMSSFTDEEGRFLLYDLEPGEYALVLPDHSDTAAMLRLSAERATPFDVGDLPLRER